MLRFAAMVALIFLSFAASTLTGQDLQVSEEQLRTLVDQRILELQTVNDSSAFDPSQVDRGSQVFQDSCTGCHDARRSSQKQKSYGAWLATVRRMAAKDGAEIDASDHEAISAYLASVSGTESDGSESESLSRSLFATISPIWRGSNGEQALENPDFFVDAWVGADWQPSGPVSANVTACTSCHSDKNQSRGFTVEFVEASVSLDLMAFLSCKSKSLKTRLKARVKAGRFIVPFGAFSAMSYPGVYRTVTNPMMFDMGRQVGPTGPLQPVLPAPYADEGVDLHLDAAIGSRWTATLDAYAVNGLQGNGPNMFNESRRYVDNNREPAVGGRVTIGNQDFRIGGSLVVGNLADPLDPSFNYKLGGVDAVYRVGNQARFYFEYAIRQVDSLFVTGQHNYAYGIVAECDLRVHSHVHLVARYDTLEHRNVDFGNRSVDRFTYGLNLDIVGGSGLSINHEHWMFGNTSDVDVLGARWTATF